MSALLAIDTAAPRLQLALLMGERLDTLVEDMAQGQAERLFPAVAELLQRNGAAYRDLQRVAATSGPGSFTGVRIGLSAARGLALALGIPALGIPSLLALSLSAPAGRPVAVLRDARRDEAYFELFAEPGRIGDGPLLLPMAAAQARIPGGATLADAPFADIAAVARFAAGADPAAFRPEAAYVRGADARPQERFRVERAEP